MPSVALIVRCFNEERHIGRLLTGALQQTRPPDEIIVVDSGSTDHTVTIASAFDVTLVTISPEEFSFGRALNRGVCAAADHDLCVFASAHVYPVYDTWLEHLVGALHSPDVVLAYGRQQAPPGARFSEARLLHHWFPADSAPRQNHPFCNNANAAVRRAVWEELPYDEELTGLEDLDWAKRAMDRGHAISYVAEAPVVHVHDESVATIVNRYRREAVAHKQIFSEQGMTVRRSDAAGRVQRVGRSAGGRRGGEPSGTPGRHRAVPGGSVLWDAARIQPDGSGSRCTPPPVLLSGGPRPTVRRSGGRSDHRVRRVRSPVKPIDISMLLTADLPIWPSSPGLAISPLASIRRGDEANVSALSMDVHSGTHVDAPRHFVADGRELEEMGLTPFVGTAEVVDVSHAEVIDADVLGAVVPEAAQRILLRTRNSRIEGFRRGGFRADYAALTPGGAAWLADRGTLLVGIDYLSVQLYDDPPDAHTALLGADVCLLEGLVLNHVSAGRYLLACLPLRLDGVEAAPARAILLPEMAP